jgi:hypothetical protein
VALIIPDRSLRYGPDYFRIEVSTRRERESRRGVRFMLPLIELMVPKVATEPVVCRFETGAGDVLLLLECAACFWGASSRMGAEFQDELG